MSYLLYSLTDKEKKLVNERMYQFKHKYGLDGITAFRRALSWVGLVKTMVQVGNAFKPSSKVIAELGRAMNELAIENKLKEEFVENGKSMREKCTLGKPEPICEYTPPIERPPKSWRYVSR